MKSRYRFPFTFLFLSACAYHTSVWVTPSDATSVTTNVSRLTEANPVWYTLDPTGAIVKKSNAEDPRLWQALSSRRLMPTIQNFVNGQFDPDVVCQAIGGKDVRRQHVRAIVDLVVKQRFDGIDIDYEALSSNIREDFSAFVTLLAAELHRNHKRLSVTVSAKTADRQERPGPGGADWRVIGRVADSVKIMAYDFHWSTSGPGPVAPLDWIARIASYAAATIPARRQFYGLPWYGYDWEGRSGHGVTYASATQLADLYRAPIARDPNGELFFRYDDHEVWFQDAESYRTKVKAILRLHPWVGGFAMWRSGAEDPGVWLDVENLNRRKVRRHE